MRTLFFLVFACSLAYHSQAQRSGFYPFKDSEGWGIARSNGVQLSTQRYDSIIPPRFYHLNSIKVAMNGNWGVIDSLGNEVVPLLYDDISIGSFGFEVKRNGKSGFRNLKGKLIVPVEFNWVAIFGMINGDFYLQCYKDREGGVLPMAIWTSDGIQRTGYDYEGSYNIEPALFNFMNMHKNDRFIELESLDGKVGVFDLEQKKVVIPVTYPMETTFHAQVEFYANGIYNITYTGTDTILHVVEEGAHSLFKLDGNQFFSTRDLNFFNLRKEYYVDENGKHKIIDGKVMEPNHLAPTPHIVYSNGVYHLIDRNGERINSENYTSLSRLVVQIDKDEHFFFLVQRSPKDSIGLYDANFKRIIPHKYSQIKWDIYKQRFEAKPNRGPRHFYSMTGEDLTGKPSFDSKAYIFSNGKINSDSRYGLVQDDGTVLVDTLYSRSRQFSHYETGFDGGLLQLYNNELTDCYFYDVKRSALHHFEGKLIWFVKSDQDMDNAAVIVLHEKSFDVFSLSKQKYLIKDQQIFANKKVISGDTSRYFSPQKHMIDDEVYWSVGRQNYGWNLFDSKGTLLEFWEDDLPTMKLLHYSNSAYCVHFSPLSNAGNSYVKNQTGDTLEIRKQEVFEYYSKLGVYYWYGAYERRGSAIYGTDFNRLGRFSSITFMGDFLYGRSVDSERILFFNENHETFLSLPANVYIKRLGDGCVEASVGSQQSIITSETTQDKRISYPRIYEYSNNLIFAIQNYDVPYSTDIYTKEGEILMEHCDVVYRHYDFLPYQNDYKYFAVQKDGVEYWMTEKGEVYFSRKL